MSAAKGDFPILVQGSGVWYRIALAASIALAVAGIAMLPLVATSMYHALTSDRSEILYDLDTGQPLTLEDVDPGGNQYLNLSVISIDPASSALTLAVSGNRSCPGECGLLRLSLLSLDRDAARRRGLTPFATVLLGANETMFSETVTLPVRGSPVRYPFDRYEIWLGLAAPASPTSTSGSTENGAATPPPSSPAAAFQSTIQNQMPQMVMLPPEMVSAGEVSAQTSPFTVGRTLHLTFRRPDYLMALSAMLILLVASSSALTVLTQPLSTLILGVGGLIIAIWGVRAVLAPQNFPLVTAVDLALSGVILLLLVGLSARVALSLLSRNQRFEWLTRYPGP
ncbi:MAG: hypothetical protein KC442_04505 [Thermomicrobiales bacterium]|nr:hypothetical protein [Thermomicrobiales bacterium]